MDPHLAPFTIMAKPVCGVCNLRCAYCYYLDKPRELYPAVTRFHMAPAVLESYTRQHLAAQPEHCGFLWQGGEPLLAGMDFFQRALDLQRQYALPRQEVTNALQSNGTLLDDAWCEFLAAQRFLVGISLDGPQRVHDHFRQDAAGKGSFDRAWAGLELLRKHGVECNVLVTLHTANAAQAPDIYRFFVNRGVRYLQFIPILERTAAGAPTDWSCTAEQFGRAMLEVFETWRDKDVGLVSERFIDNTLHTLVFGEASLCCHAARCANAFVLEFNGDLYACDHFVRREWLIGNILEKPLGQLVAHPLVEQFARLKTELPARCRECEYLNLCRGGCPKHHHSLADGPPPECSPERAPERDNHFCAGYRMFYEKALPELRRIAQGIARDGRLPLPRKAPRTQPQDLRR